MKKSFITIFICLLACNGIAQSRYTDSLKVALAHTTDPLQQFNLFNKMLEYGYITGEGNPDSSYCIDLLRIAKQQSSDSLFAIAYNQVGNYFFRTRGDFSSAIEYFFKGIPFAEAIHDKRRL